MTADATDLQVLVVDDTPAIRMLLRMNLELEGCSVVEACDGGEALAQLRDPSVPRPDAVTIDILMHPRTGWWVLEEIRRDPELRDLPVVMITASVQAHQRTRAELAGIDAFVAKPFEPSEVAELVVSLARSGRRGRQPDGRTDTGH